MPSNDAGTPWTFVPAVSEGAPINTAGHTAFATPLAIFKDVDVTRSGDVLTLSARTVIDDADPHLRAHFPNFTIFPGVFLIESLRQAVALALEEAPQITEVRSVRFLAPLVPGDQMRLFATIACGAGGTYDVDAHVRSDETVAATLKVRFGPSAGAAPDHACLPVSLPHGHPMLLVDRVVALEPGKSITAIKAVSRTEPCYRALQPDVPPHCLAYPTSLLLESFGQTGAILWLASATEEMLQPDGIVMLTSARNCRIEGHAYPGDILRHYVRLDKIIGNTLIVEGETWVEERRIAAIESMIATVRSRTEMAERTTNAQTRGTNRLSRRDHEPGE